MYSHARDALKASPLLSAPPPLPLPLVTICAAINTPITAAIYAQNSVVLNACLVSVAKRDATRFRATPVRTSLPAWVAMCPSSKIEQPPKTRAALPPRNCPTPPTGKQHGRTECDRFARSR